MLTYHPYFPLWCPTARQKVEWRLDWSSSMHMLFGQMPSRDKQLKANCLRGWKMPWCTDCEGFIWHFIAFEISTALLSPSKIAQPQREWMTIQNIHYYYSLQKCSSGNPIKRNKYIKCKNSLCIFTLYIIYLRCYPWHPLPFPTIFSVFFVFVISIFFIPVARCSKGLLWSEVFFPDPESQHPLILESLHLRLF